MHERTVHMIWIQDSRAFSIGEWCSLLSVLKNTEYNLVLHTNLSPGQAAPFDPYSITHDRFSIEPREFEMVVEGVRARPANISDMERIRILYERGGIYSDMDIIWLREIDLSGCGPVVTAYENPSYKTVANAFIVAPPGWEPFKTLLDDMRQRFIALRCRNILDITGDPPVGLSKNHTLLWKLTGDVMKANGATILGKSHFYKNGWRRIGREVSRRGGVLGPRVDPALLGTTADRVSLDGIVGFHYYAGLFQIHQLLIIPCVRSTIEALVAYGQSFGVGAANLTA